MHPPRIVSYYRSFRQPCVRCQIPFLLCRRPFEKPAPSYEPLCLLHPFLLRWSRHKTTARTACYNHPCWFPLLPVSFVCILTSVYILVAVPMRGTSSKSLRSTFYYPYIISRGANWVI